MVFVILIFVPPESAKYPVWEQSPFPLTADSERVAHDLNDVLAAWRDLFKVTPWSTARVWTQAQILLCKRLLQPLLTDILFY